MGKIKLDASKAPVVDEKRPKKALPLEIVKIPRELTKGHIQEDGYIQVDDECYAFDYYRPIGDFKHGGGIILFALIMHFIGGGGFEWFPTAGTIPIALLGLYFIVKALFIKNDKLIMDRMQNLFSYPNYWTNTPAILYFKNVYFFMVHKGKTQAPYLVVPYTNWGVGSYTLSVISIKDRLSFYVWYMDKNRPLPPGSAFDPYRQKDFERRKAAGFPPPLYYSCGIPTPEATPEQQAEREQYWKDREYFAPDIKRSEDSEIFNIRTHTDWVATNFKTEDGKGILPDKWHEITFDNGKIVYMLTDENGVGYLPPDTEKYKVVSLTIKKNWY